MTDDLSKQIQENRQMLVIFDLDGTLSLTEHREHFLLLFVGHTTTPALRRTVRSSLMV